MFVVYTIKLKHCIFLAESPPQSSSSSTTSSCTVAQAPNHITTTNNNQDYVLPDTTVNQQDLSGQHGTKKKLKFNYFVIGLIFAFLNKKKN